MGADKGPSGGSSRQPKWDVGSSCVAGALLQLSEQLDYVSSQQMASACRHLSLELRR